MATNRVLQVTPHSPLLVRVAHNTQKDAKTVYELSKALDLPRDEILQKLDALQEQYTIENEALVILLQATRGDVELSVTILAHLLGTSTSDLYERHSNELASGYKVAKSKSDFIREMTKGTKYSPIPKAIQDLSNLLRLDDAQIIEKLNDLADRLEKEERAFFTLRGTTQNGIGQATILGYLTNLSIGDLRIRHPELFPQTRPQVLPQSAPKPMLQPSPEPKRIAVGTLVR